MKVPVGLLNDRTVCVSRWRGLTPTSSDLLSYSEYTILANEKNAPTYEKPGILLLRMYLISSVPSGRSYGGRRCRSTSCLCPFCLTALLPWSVVLSYDKVWDAFRWKQGIRFVFRRIQKIRTLLLSKKVRILLIRCTSRDSNSGPTDQESKPPIRLNSWKFRVIVSVR